MVKYTVNYTAKNDRTLRGSKSWRSVLHTSGVDALTDWATSSLKFLVKRHRKQLALQILDLIVFWHVISSNASVIVSYKDKGFEAHA